MLAGNALRHQMILPEQQALYDYWRAHCQNGRLPSRHDINPADLGDYLPTMSIVELRPDDNGMRYQYRLAGTGLYSIYSQEITGSYLTDLPKGSRRAYWNRVLGRVTERARPSAGVVRSAISGKTHMAQFWIRLPLSKDGTTVSMILGFDKFVKLSEMTQPAAITEKISA